MSLQLFSLEIVNTLTFYSNKSCLEKKNSTINFIETIGKINELLTNKLAWKGLKSNSADEDVRII